MEDEWWDADLFTSGMGDCDGVERWQVAVDSVYVLLKAGVIWCPELIPLYGGAWNERCADYVFRLARNNPLSGDLDEYVEWKQYEFRLADWVIEIVSEKGWEAGWADVLDGMNRRFESEGIDLMCRPFVRLVF